MTLFRHKINQINTRLKTQVYLAYLYSLCQIKTRHISLLTKRHPNPLGDEIYYTGIIFPDNRSRANEFLQVSGMSSQSILESCGKAFSEYLEVIACHEIGHPFESTRSGWATADSIEKAQERADLELLERDSFLMHFFCSDLKTKVFRAENFSIKDARWGSGHDSHKSKSLPLSWKLSGLKLARLQCLDSSIAVVVAGYHATDAGWFLGLGAAHTEKLAIEKSILECVMLTNEWKPDQSTTSVSGTIKELLKFHWMAGKSEDVTQRLNLIFSGGTDILCRAEIDPIKSSLTQHQRRFSSQHIVIQRTNPQLIPLTFGKKWEDSQDKVLGLLKERGLSPLSWLPHPLL